MQKIFVKTKQINNNQVSIIGEDIKHIVNVLHMQIDEKIQICNMENSENYIAKIKKIQKEEIIAEITEKLNISTESNVKIDLYQGLPKADKMELIIQKTTELGISRLIPTELSRCIVKLEEKNSEKKIERWQKIAEAAAKQSKRDRIPKIENITEIKNIELQNYDLFLVAYEEETEQTLKQELKKLPKQTEYEIGILIGPEGGIEFQEIETLKENGAKIVTLGKRILRTETAPIAMVSNIIYELEN